MKKIFAVLGLLLTASLLSPAQVIAAPRPEPVEVDHIVAVVGTEVITNYELKKRLQAVRLRLQKQGTPLPPEDELAQQMLERLIIDRVQLQQARESGIAVDDAQLANAIERIAANNKMSVEQFRNELTKSGLPYAEFREEIRQEIMVGRLREREVDSRIMISDAEIDNYLANAAATDSAEYALAHILLRAPEGASPEQLQKLKKRAVEAQKRAQSGENFARLAAAFSDAADALSGGELGWRQGANLPQLYAETAASLGVGQVSEVLRSPAGFHVLKLLQKRGGKDGGSVFVQQTHARHILVRVNEVVSESQARHKIALVRERIVNGGDFGEQARLYSQDGSAGNGGDLGWINPGDTVPEFEKAMNDLPVGGLSEAVKSPFGIHLITVLERRQQDISDNRRRALARQALRERRLDEAYQDWLRQLRDKTYVEIRLNREE